MLPNLANNNKIAIDAMIFSVINLHFILGRIILGKVYFYFLVNLVRNLICSCLDS